MTIIMCQSNNVYLIGFLVSGVIVTELQHQHLVLFQVLYTT